MKLFVCHLILPSLLILFCCFCVASEHGKSDTFDQHRIKNIISRFKHTRSGPKDYKESSRDSLPTNSNRADFPCPDSAAIVPCTCEADSSKRVFVNCTFVESVDQLLQVFSQEFPVKDLYRFTMENNSAVDFFPSFMNGITFESVYLGDGDSILEAISEHFLLDLKDTLKQLVIYNSKLITDFFPFYMLPLMNELEELQIGHSGINWIPEIRAPKLSHFTVENSLVEILTNGTFSIGPGPMTIQVFGNQIHTIELGSIFFADQNSAASNELIYVSVRDNQLQSLKAGTFPMRNGRAEFYLHSSKIASIEPGTFVFPESTDFLSIYLKLSYNELITVDEAVFGKMMPFLTNLYLVGNPLTCGCDMAWLITNSTLLETVSDGTCADGTDLHDLDPQEYIDYC